jgi:flagellar biosynthesis protein FlhF
MRIKKYLARSMREALLQIKDELGEEAIILKTRKLPRKVFSLGATEEVEVTAAVDETKVNTQVVEPLRMATETGVYARPRPAGTSPVLKTGGGPEPFVRSWVPPRANIIPAANVKSQVRPEVKGPDKEYLEIKDDIRELSELVKTVLTSGGTAPVSAGGFSGGRAILYKKLLDSEVKPEVAEKLIQGIHGADISSDENMEKKFADALSDHFPMTGPLKLKKGSPLIVAFVGPTGSGKTTTLAKLAAYCCINKGKSVSIITADTYRIAAIEQIRMFADIVKVNLQVVFSPEEITKALESCKNDDVVFVDTAGRSQRNREHMNDLKNFLEALKPDETHLVLSATTKDSDLADTIKRYKPLGVNRLLFTKLDETGRCGNILNIASESALPVSYFTFGQSVPDDIELAQPGAFVKRLWEGRAS